MVYDSAGDLVRVVVASACAYFALILALRLSGKRTLSQLNAFDLVVTVALGSTLASAMLTETASISEAVAAFAVLIALQFAVSFASVRSRALRRIARSSPTLLAVSGTICDDALRRERLTVAEVHQAIRSRGLGSLDAVGAVVLETDGSVSVIPGDAIGDGSALAHLAAEAAGDERRDT